MVRDQARDQRRARRDGGQDRGPAPAAGGLFSVEGAKPARRLGLMARPFRTREHCACRRDATSSSTHRIFRHRLTAALSSPGSWEDAIMATTDTIRPSAQPAQREGVLVRLAIGFTAWAEKWFPDAFIFVAIAVVVVALAALLNGASPAAVSTAFGNGFWS